MFSGLVIVVIVWKNKKAKNVLSIFLCVSIVASAFSGLQPEVYAVEETSKIISVSENIVVDNATVTLKANVACTRTSDNDVVDLHSIWGDDIIPELNYTPQPANPTFNSRDEEIKNLAEINE